MATRMETWLEGARSFFGEHHLYQLLHFFGIGTEHNTYLSFDHDVRGPGGGHGPRDTDDRDFVDGDCPITDLEPGDKVVTKVIIDGNTITTVCTITRANGDVETVTDVVTVEDTGKQFNGKH